LPFGSLFLGSPDTIGAKKMAHGGDAIDKIEGIIYFWMEKGQ
jgi:hypothetical protein